MVFNNLCIRQSWLSLFSTLVLASDIESTELFTAMKEQPGASWICAHLGLISFFARHNMKIGFIGLGTMGAAMATNLMKAGYALTVNDIDKNVAEPFIKQGAAWAETPFQLAQQADIVFTSLPGPTQVEVVLAGPDGLAAGLRPATVVFDLSTNAPSTVRKLHLLLAKQGVFLLDAPVSGGPSGAASGQLTIWVSGNEQMFQKHRKILSAMSNDTQYMGDIGAASVAKLVHNCMGYMFNSAVAEVFTMGVKAGVKPAALFKALRSGAMGRRRTFDSLASHFLSGNYDPPKFALRLAHKDVTLATDLGREVDVPMRIAQLTLEQMSAAIERGWGGKDSRIAMLLQQELAGVDVHCEPDELRDILNS
ncbi:MAG: NAD(P)-dependent oxidoreductase [Pusillimonas sp.]